MNAIEERAYITACYKRIADEEGIAHQAGRALGWSSAALRLAT